MATELSTENPECCQERIFDANLLSSSHLWKTALSLASCKPRRA